MEKNLDWYRHEHKSLEDMREKNDNEITRLQAFIDNKKEERSYKEEQIKAQKKQNKLIAIAIQKVQQQNRMLEDERGTLTADMNMAIKESI